jgi:hypothetical protein
MAPPPSVRQISRDTLGDVPSWVDRFLRPLNQFMTQTADALNGAITSQNLAEAWVDLTVKEGTSPQPFIAQLRGRPVRGLYVTKVSALGAGGTPGVAPTGPVFILWEPATVDGQPGVSISQVFGLSPGGTYNITLLIKAE